MAFSRWPYPSASLPPVKSRGFSVIAGCALALTFCLAGCGGDAGSLSKDAGTDPAVGFTPPVVSIPTVPPVTLPTLLPPTKQRHVTSRPTHETTPSGPRLVGDGYSVSLFSGWSKWTATEDPEDIDKAERSGITGAVIGTTRPVDAPAMIPSADSPALVAAIKTKIAQATGHPVTRLPNLVFDGEPGIGFKSWEDKSGVRVDRFQYFIIHASRMYGVVGAIRSTLDSTFDKTMSAYARGWRWA